MSNKGQITVNYFKKPLLHITTHFNDSHMGKFITYKL